MPFFNTLTLLPEDPIFKIPTLFAADPRPHKVNLGVGSYRDAEGRPYLLDCVRDAEAALLSTKRSKEYLPIEGDAQLIKHTECLIFGKQLLDSHAGSFFTAQTVGGTGALYLGGKFLSQGLSKAVYLPNSTWPNHPTVFARSGMEVHSYSYYDDSLHQIDFDSMCRDISLMPPGSTLLLHPSCHNPTGIDPSPEQWQELSALVKHQRLLPFFDFAYQGFKGTIDEDAFALRYFLSQGHEMLVSYSFAKNFGLYGERVGALSVVCHDEQQTPIIASHLKKMIRNIYSNPPRHGAEVIAMILGDEQMKATWLHELGNMRYRLKEMRHTLITGLQAKKSNHDWSFLNRQNGFFSFCGLNDRQVQRMIRDYAIYMPSNGRINVGGLNGHNMDYVIDAIIDVMDS